MCHQSIMSDWILKKKSEKSTRKITQETYLMVDSHILNLKAFSEVLMTDVFKRLFMKANIC